MPSAATPLSGEQHELRAGGYTAVVASVGASLRVLSDEHGDLIVPYAAEEIRPAMRGALLAPWPNRIAGGRYEIGGATHQLALSEPERGNAAHGLVAWQDFSVVRREDAAVMLSSTIAPQPGYPWRLRLDVTFALGEGGLSQRAVATNESRQPAPYGVAGHPYLLAGPPVEAAVDRWHLQLPADEVVVVSPDRLIPTGIERVDQRGGHLDFRSRRRIGESVLNHAFGGLRRGADGYARTRMTDDLGFGVELACDSACRWIQVYTADESEGADRRHGLAVEPMTCPPDAYNSKLDLITIPPGASFSAGWRIRRIAP